MVTILWVMVMFTSDGLNVDDAEVSRRGGRDERGMDEGCPIIPVLLGRTSAGSHDTHYYVTAISFPHGRSRICVKMPSFVSQNPVFSHSSPI
eukprot:scaffold2366_cov115-Cylindrotheca_fusiformis.AAC.5